MKKKQCTLPEQELIRHDLRSEVNGSGYFFLALSSVAKALFSLASIFIYQENIIIASLSLFVVK